MSARAHDAILLDLDGTLLDASERVHPRNREALLAAQEAGVVVMVSTGRSWMSAEPILEELGLEAPAVLFNGAALYDPTQGRLVEERVLSKRTLERCHAFRRAHGDLAVVMSARRKLCLQPRSDAEARSLEGLIGVEHVTVEELEAQEYVIRMTFLCDREDRSVAYSDAILRHVDQPVYLTHFPLNLLVRHRQSPFVAVDVHPPCNGKAEALRVLQERYGVPAERVVAVGDAGNDEPMLRAAGLGVAMGNATAELRALADRVIGDHDEPVIADLVEELFLGARA